MAISPSLPFYLLPLSISLSLILSVSCACLLKDKFNYRSGLIEWAPRGRGRGMSFSNETYISGTHPYEGVVCVRACVFEKPVA